MKLNELQIGSTATILSVGERALRQHFLDMGLIQGTVTVYTICHRYGVN